MSSSVKTVERHRIQRIPQAQTRLPASGRSGVRRQIAEMVRRIVTQFRPERIVLFGSRARRDAAPGSDVDLLVVMPVNGSKRARQLEIRIALHDIHCSKDIVVVSPREWDVLRDIPGTIVRPAWLEGKVLYEKS